MVLMWLREGEGGGGGRGGGRNTDWTVQCGSAAEQQEVTRLHVWVFSFGVKFESTASAGVSTDGPAVIGQQSPDQSQWSLVCHQPKVTLTLKILLFLG